MPDTPIVLRSDENRIQINGDRRIARIKKRHLAHRSVSSPGHGQQPRPWSAAQAMVSKAMTHETFATSKALSVPARM